MIIDWRNTVYLSADSVQRHSLLVSVFGIAPRSNLLAKRVLAKNSMHFNAYTWVEIKDKRKKKKEKGTLFICLSKPVRYGDFLAIHQSMNVMNVRIKLESYTATVLNLWNCARSQQIGLQFTWHWWDTGPSWCWQESLWWWSGAPRSPPWHSRFWSALQTSVWSHLFWFPGVQWCSLLAGGRKERLWSIKQYMYPHTLNILHLKRCLMGHEMVWVPCQSYHCRNQVWLSVTWSLVQLIGGILLYKKWSWQGPCL